MDEHQYHSFKYDLERINESLKKIIKLLELRNSIEVARNQMKRGTIYFDDSEVFPQSAGINPDILCNCGNHKTGQSTGGWFCPVHG